MKCKKREWLNHSTYGVYGHTFAVSAYTSSLTLFLQLQKNDHSVNLFELSNFGNLSGSGTKKATEECDQKILLIKGQRKLSQLKEALFGQFLQQTKQS